MRRAALLTLLDTDRERFLVMLLCKYRDVIAAAQRLSMSENKRKAERHKPGRVVRKSA